MQYSKNFYQIKSKSYNKSLHFFESTDPMNIKSRLSKLELEDTHFNKDYTKYKGKN
ncbi:MAG: hypothetical protein JJV94_07040 [Sulfurospirillum sp.]|nr:hypothetical protein [Sulfurospirillum sp.]